MFDYEILRIFWWLLLGLLLCSFAIVEGFDLGVAALLPWLARTDTERDVVVQIARPMLRGYSFLLVVVIIAVLTAWPSIGAVVFSGFYITMSFILFTFLLRPLVFKYRHKLPFCYGRILWDWLLCLSSIAAVFIFGITVGNVLQGVPFQLNPMLKTFYTGHLLMLFNPFALLCGALSVAMCVMHSGVYLVAKTEHAIKYRAIHCIRMSGLLVMVLFTIGGIWISNRTGYVITSFTLTHKAVALEVGAWLFNYYSHPWLLGAPVLGFIGALLATLTAELSKNKLALVASACSIVGIIVTVGISMFPFILPSSSHPEVSLLVWDASSSHWSIAILFLATMSFLILMSTWIYRWLRYTI